jgi:hypothetical protein
MKNIFFVVLFFSFGAAAQKTATIEGNEQIGKAAQSETDGQANTRAIVTAVGKNSGYDGKVYAAKVCDTLNAGGYSDWYLPCKEETNIIHLNYEKLKLDEKMTIWSSTEASGTGSNQIFLQRSILQCS